MRVNKTKFHMKDFRLGRTRGFETEGERESA